LKLATSGDVVEICHAQLEVGAASTSPIYGAEVMALTRLKDYPHKTSATSLIGQTEGTIEFEFDAGDGFDLTVWTLVATGLTGFTKVRVTYTGTTIKLYVNDILVDSDTGTYDWSGMDLIELGSIDNEFQLNSGIKYTLISKTAIEL